MSKRILTSHNPKLQKSVEFGYLSFGIHLAPAAVSGTEMCPGRTRGCTKSCLNLAGMGVMVQPERIEKTRRLVDTPLEFAAQLEKEIAAECRKAARMGLTPAVRLNLTSDVAWEKMRIFSEDRTIFEVFPEVQFYDYTKVYARLEHGIPNYHLTFSRAETKLSDLRARHALATGQNAAVVFSTPKGEPLPETWHGHPVIDGDVNDLRFLDPRGVVVGLRAKGPARKDTTGFVVQLQTA
jgi:hypothetical protein